MGTFEKLGILVIVVIIVMILAVAIYQWGGAGGPPGSTVMELPAGSELTVKTIDQLREEHENAGQKPSLDGDTAAWPGGIPKSYTILKDDKVWVIVVKRWGLKESFIQEIEGANSKIDFKRLRPGTVIAVPDPSRFMRSAAEPAPAPPKTGPTRRYEVQGGDTLENIAYRHLGSKTRWPDIVSLNPGLEPKRLFEGQEIYLPVK
ncbi:MAG: LysM peptidoglycan-binding domain-containing protein [Planctomycetes bacterium]|nr:LysM peptidoglycan-binding domain-containing protein [Planctomycetota bacterium]